MLPPYCSSFYQPVAILNRTAQVFTTTGIYHAYSALGWSLLTEMLALLLVESVVP